MLQSVTEFILDVLFPKKCVGCGREGAFTCENCRPALAATAPTCFVCEKRSPDGSICEPCKPETRLRQFVAPLRYHDHFTRELIHTFKFGGAKEISKILAKEITDSLGFYAIPTPPRSLLIPIPLHPKRLRERGFNQAELLARELEMRLHIPINTTTLLRTTYRDHQTKMPNREQRIKNAKGIYRVADKIPPGTTAILVDDVSTTGATIEEAARVLKAAGAKQVWAFVAAR